MANHPHNEHEEYVSLPRNYVGAAVIHPSGQLLFAQKKKSGAHKTRHGEKLRFPKIELMENEKEEHAIIRAVREKIGVSEDCLEFVEWTDTYEQIAHGEKQRISKLIHMAIVLCFDPDTSFRPSDTFYTEPRLSKIGNAIRHMRHHEEREYLRSTQGRISELYEKHKETMYWIVFGHKTAMKKLYAD